MEKNNVLLFGNGLNRISNGDIISPIAKIWRSS